MKPAALCRSSDFRRVHGEGSRSRRNGVSAAALDRGDAGPPRIGFAVRRSAGPAVTRNRIKRRLRAAARSLELAPGFDVVVSGGPEAASIDFHDLVTRLDGALRKVGAVT